MTDPIDRPRFASTMLSLSLALKMYGKELSKPLQDVYWHALRDLSVEEFERAAQVLIRRETEFPPPAMFLEVARPVADTAAVAFRVLNRALLLTDYDPEGGTTWRGLRIREVLGDAAYEAFLACGGAPGFRLYDDAYHGPKVRREFMDCYQRVVKADPRLALPAGPDQTPERFKQYLTGIGRPMPALLKP